MLKAHNGLDWSWVRSLGTAPASLIPPLRTRLSYDSQLQACITSRNLARRLSIDHAHVTRSWDRHRAVLLSKAVLLNSNHLFVIEILWKRVEAFLHILQRNLSALPAASTAPASVVHVSEPLSRRSLARAYPRPLSRAYPVPFLQAQRLQRSGALG